MTFCELLYLSVYATAGNYPAFVTRYPITGFGSIYPSKVFLKPTVTVEVRKELDNNWDVMGDTHTAYQFPVTGTAFINSMSPSSTKLALLAADFDGDTSSLNIVYSDEAIEEVDKYLSSKKYYINSSGNLSFSTNTSTVGYVIQNMTG